MNQSGMAETRLDSRNRERYAASGGLRDGDGYSMASGGNGQVVVLMNKRGRRFMEES